MLSMSLALMNRTFDQLPPGRWMHRVLQRGLQFTDVEIPLHRGMDELDGLRIAFLSDIHAGSYMSATDLQRIFARVAEQQPDLVCLGGDMINTREREILMFRDALPLIDPPLGIYAVPGNHDHFWGQDLGLWSAFLTELGVQVLLNRGVRITHRGAEFWLAGVDDLTEGDPDLRQALQGSRPDEPLILLSHHPDFFYEAAQVGVDLTISGHTHGGQIHVRGRSPVVHSEFGYLRGLFTDGPSRLYVGRGVGVSVLPVRIGAPPEVPIIRLRVGSPSSPSSGAGSGEGLSGG
jgi:hypothetical protein